MKSLKNLKIRKIGTSKGIIIPAGILKELDVDLGDSVDITICKSSKIREGWSEAFRDYATEVEEEDKVRSPGVKSVAYKVHYRLGRSRNVKWKFVVIPAKSFNNITSIRNYAKDSLIESMGARDIIVTKVELYRIYYGDDNE